MLRILIELVPGGDESRARVLGALGVANDATGTRARGNYEVVVMDKVGRKFKEFRIENWPRQAKSVWQFVRHIFNTGFGKGETHG